MYLSVDLSIYLPVCLCLSDCFPICISNNFTNSTIQHDHLQLNQVLTKSPTVLWNLDDLIVSQRPNDSHRKRTRMLQLSSNQSQVISFNLLIFRKPTATSQFLSGEHHQDLKLKLWFTALAKQTKTNWRNFMYHKLTECWAHKNSY